MNAVARASVFLLMLWVGDAAFAQSQPAAFTDYYRFDLLGRTVGTITSDPDGASGPLPYLASRTSYDADGRVVKTEKGSLGTWQPDNVDPQTWADFAPYSTTTMTYDFADRKTSETVTGADGAIKSFKQYNYDLAGRLQCTAIRMDPAQWTSQTDACAPQTNGPNGPDRVTRSLYDAAGQVLKVQKALGTDIQQDYQSYNYTPNGKPSYVIDANGNKSAYGYDGFDRLILWAFPSITTPGAASTTDFEQYDYDANGNRTSLRKRDGRTINYTYDALNRMTVKAFVNGGACVSGYACTTPPSSSVRDVYYSYDLRGLQTSARFDSANGGDAATNTYDGFGRLTSNTVSMAGVSRTISRAYDADGNRIKVTHPDGVYFTYDYDGLDRMLDVKQNGGTQIASLVYGSQGTQITSNRGPVATTYTYDSIARIAGISDHLPLTVSADVSTTFAYNQADQIVSQTRSNDAYAFSDYVAASNAYAANGLNQYTAVGAGSLGYDSNGNLASNGGTSFTYDVENRLVAAAGTLTVSMIYDPMGRLYQTTGTTLWSQFAYDGDQVIVNYNNGGYGRYIYGPGEDDPLIWYSGASLLHPYPLQKDRQGSIVSIASQDGSLRFINTYDEYGVPGNANVGLFQYTGQMYLADLGMYYYKARIYSARLGRFLQTDPIGYKDQMDLYAYVGNDPIDHTDPTGENCAQVEGSCTPEQSKQATQHIVRVETAHPTATKVVLGTAAVAVTGGTALAMLPEAAAGTAVATTGATATDVTGSVAARASQSLTAPTIRSAVARVAARIPKPLTGVARVGQADAVPVEYRAAQMAARQGAKVESAGPWGDFFERVGDALAHAMHLPGY